MTTRDAYVDGNIAVGKAKAKASYRLPAYLHVVRKGLTGEKLEQAVDAFMRRIR